MTKHEAAVIMAYSGIITLTGDDLKHFYAYIAQILNCPCTPDYVKAYPKDVVRAKAKQDFVELCRTATETDAKAVLTNRLKHLLQSDYIRQFDEKDPRTGAYMRDIKTATGAAQQQRGTWKAENSRPKSYKYICSICGGTAYERPAPTSKAPKRCSLKFCPHCGAIMDGGGDDAGA